MSSSGGHGAPILGKVYLVERQKKIAELVLSGVSDADELARSLGVRREDIMRDFEELKARGLVEVERLEATLYALSEEGERCLREGLPEERVLSILEELGAAPRERLLEEAERRGVRRGEAEIGVSQLAAAKVLSFAGGSVSLADPEGARAVVERNRRSLSMVAQGAAPGEALLAALRRRGLVKARKRVVIRVRPTQLLLDYWGKGLVAEARVVTELTPEMLASGAWRTVVFKPFDLSVEPPSAPLGRKHPYLEFLDWLREILVEMGFEEMKGPHVELELWNFDALFQAQDHPAREIHDTYVVKGGMRGEVGSRELLERVARAHESGGDTGSRGWGYKWDPSRALRLVLRTQTTAVSARTLYQRGAGEYMCFSLGRVFRPENLDAKHSMEFYQLEGIIVGRRVTFRTLLGFFDEVARRLGLGRVKVKPAYFPFTEPSVEGFVKHEKLGWIEVFPGGMFRPEMLSALGVRGVNVAAWGVGIDRIAMVVLGIDDIRLLFSQNLEFIVNSPRAIPLSLVG